jgi:hypothetical protein
MRYALIGFAGLMALGALVLGVAFAHDALRTTLTRSRLEAMTAERLRPGASEDDAVTYVRELEAAKPHGAIIHGFGPEPAGNDDCIPKPCSLARYAVTPGTVLLGVRVSNPAGWLPAVCNDDYVMYLAFDTTGRYVRPVFTDAAACL